VRVLHLVGSPTDEFHAELSLLYARDCLTATADPERYVFLLAYVDPDGCWRFPDDLSRAALDAAVTVPVGEAISHLIALDPDVVVPQLFCRTGMTVYRGLFDVLGVPYVGNRPDAMALGADKARARVVVAAAGVAVPEAELLRPGQHPTMAPPVVVKPVDTDNSVGVSLVRRHGELAPALQQAFVHSDRVLVERYVELGREVRVGVLEVDGDLVCLPLEEYAVGPDAPVRGRDDKLADHGDELRLVAKDATRAWLVDPTDPVNDAVHDLARRSHEALGCRHYSLFDVRIDPEGRPWFLEAGLYCSFARQSVVAVMAAGAGVPVESLFATMLAQAIAGTPGPGADGKPRAAPSSRPS